MGESRPKSDKTPQSEYQRVKELMKELGSQSGFDPIPPDQHKWMIAWDQPPLQRMWAWMLGHTIHWGHRSPYAIDKGTGRELNIENAAQDLKDQNGEPMDLSNLYRVWRRGVERGIWRNGSTQEGSRRLYLTGKVPKFSGEDEAKRIVCTDYLPSSIRKQIQDWDAERQAKLRIKWDEELELQGHVQA